MARTPGIPDVVVGLIDGPVAVGHPDLTAENLQSIPGMKSRCSGDSPACRHGTFLAGILNAKRSSTAPGICPECTLLLRPVFSEWESASGELPCTSPVELAAAILDCVNAGARILNLSIALEDACREERELKEALDYAEGKQVIVLAAAGNQGAIGGSALTRHPWVIPVVACDLRGRLTAYSNNGGTLARKGISAPGEKIRSLGSGGQNFKVSGTSTATAFVTGAIALLWSELPRADGTVIKSAATGGRTAGRQRSCPPLLDAWRAFQRIRGSSDAVRTKQMKLRAIAPRGGKRFAPDLRRKAA